MYPVNAGGDRTQNQEFRVNYYPGLSNLIDDMMALSYVRLHDYARGRAMTQDRDGRHDLSVQWMQQDYLRDNMPVVHGL